jgi:hypothetical protein
LIDSFIFRLTDLTGVHRPLVDYLHKFDSGVTTYGKEVIEDDNPDYWRSRVNIVRFAIDHAKGKSFEMAHRNFLESHHYDTAYFINESQDYIEFNLSIPKYLWGTNILQFVPHCDDLDFKNSYDATIQDVGGQTHERFMRFLHWWCERELNGLVLWSRAQVCRIDLCYNKLFNSKEDAMFYLSELKRVKKKYLRDSSLHINNYHSGIYFPNRDYTLKIYHKGSEFITSHRGKRSNYLRVKSAFGIKTAETLKEFADKMLRYEIEFKPRLIDRVFKDRIFRSKSAAWKVARKMYVQVSGTGYAKIKGVNVHPVNFSPEQKAAYKFAHFVMSKQFQFQVKREKATFHKSDNDLHIGEYQQKMGFSQRLFREMVAKFVQMKNEFTVSWSDDLWGLFTKIEVQAVTGEKRTEILLAYYTRAAALAGKELSKSDQHISYSMAKKILLLLRSMSLKEMKETGHLKDAVYYRYKKFLEVMGISQVTASQKIAVTDDGFYDYQVEVERNISRLPLPNVTKAVF